MLPKGTDLHSIRQPCPDLHNHWRSLESKAEHAVNIDVAELTQLAESGAKVWHLLPGLTALQQLVQPLLEALILADRLWSLDGCSDVAFATLVRLFDPMQSPRCMALVAVKKSE